MTIFLQMLDFTFNLVDDFQHLCYTATGEKYRKDSGSARMEIWATDRLPLESARNIREMGGYPAADGRTTRRGLFLRGDGISNLTEQDCERLYGYGVRMVLDLRCRSEWQGQNLPLLGYRDILYGSLPMLDDVIVEPSIEDFPESLGIQYIRMLEQYKKKIRAIFLCLASENEDCVLFHCTAGKDRTGVVAMLLLMLAGTPEEFIVADYVKTDQYVRNMMDARMEELAEMGIHYPEHVFRTDPDNIRLAMRHIHENYGDSKGYLRACDVREEAIERLMTRFVDWQ